LDGNIVFDLVPESGANRAISNVHISDNIFYLTNTDYHAVEIQCSADPTVAKGKNIRIAGNLFDTPSCKYKSGILVMNTDSVEVVGNMLAYAPEHGISVSRCTNALIAQNIVTEAGQSTPQRGGISAVAIRASDCQNCLIQSNVCVKASSDSLRIDGSGTYFIRDNVFKDSYTGLRAVGDVPADYIEITRNNFEGVTEKILFVTAPSSYQIRRNRNYLTENSGTATFSGDGTTTQFSIAHGLVSTPTKVLVTPMTADAASDFYVTADDTNIYINYKSAPPSGTDNLKFSWYAEV